MRTTKNANIIPAMAAKFLKYTRRNAFAPKVVRICSARNVCLAMHLNYGIQKWRSVDLASRMSSMPRRADLAFNVLSRNLFITEDTASHVLLKRGLMLRLENAISLRSHVLRTISMIWKRKNATVRKVLHMTTEQAVWLAKNQISGMRKAENVRGVVRSNFSILKRKNAWNAQIPIQTTTRRQTSVRKMHPSHVPLTIFSIDQHWNVSVLERLPLTTAIPVKNVTFPTIGILMKTNANPVPMDNTMTSTN